MEYKDAVDAISTLEEKTSNLVATFSCNLITLETSTTGNRGKIERLSKKYSSQFSCSAGGSCFNCNAGVFYVTATSRGSVYAHDTSSGLVFCSVGDDGYS